MNGTKIKICGLWREEDIRCANLCLPDYIGFVFAESRRRVDESTAARLKAGLDPRIRAAGVFVNAETEQIRRLCGAGIIDLVQLHGDEDEAYILEVKRLTGKAVVKAVRVGETPPAPHILESPADYLLFDTLSAAGRGGTGRTFRPDLIRHVARPYFLAGGLHPGNAAEMIRLLAPYCIDVSSGVETDGRKDFAKMQAMTALL
ncbi:MAG: phosphoribosylanthranilate isomerase [Clostridiales Family XIII bacterium]|jgi:phosphoribosylanthranilate isomerase|nr:phosphoribosylanthranilate isomerase [Clostridiales Family XIII bacterium]